MTLKKNKKGSVILYTLMLGVLLFLLAMAFAPALKNTTDEARDSELLNCSTTEDSQTKAVCTSIDIQQFYFGIVLGLAAIVLIGVGVR